MRRKLSRGRPFKPTSLWGILMAMRRKFRNEEASIAGAQMASTTN